MAGAGPVSRFRVGRRVRLLPRPDGESAKNRPSSPHCLIAGHRPLVYNRAVRIEEAPPEWLRSVVTPAYMVGPRVTLRHVSLGFNREEMLRQFRWGQDDELQFWSGSVPAAPSLAQFEAEVLTWCDNHDARRDRYVILDEAGTMIGIVSYFNLIYERRQAELGIYIGERSCWSRGYGTEAILTLMGHLFRYTNLNSMILTTYASNARAQACYRKCGFEMVGSSRKFSGRAGYYVDVQMRLTRERFQH
ncbi:MAG: GNAT family N-acetyltransferase, partial [Chloroflexota bacterium]